MDGLGAWAAGRAPEVVDHPWLRLVVPAGGLFVLWPFFVWVSELRHCGPRLSEETGDGGYSRPMSPEGASEHWRRLCRPLLRRHRIPAQVTVMNARGIPKGDDHRQSYGPATLCLVAQPLEHVEMRRDDRGKQLTSTVRRAALCLNRKKGAPLPSTPSPPSPPQPPLSPVGSVRKFFGGKDTFGKGKRLLRHFWYTNPWISDPPPSPRAPTLLKQGWPRAATTHGRVLGKVKCCLLLLTKVGLLVFWSSTHTEALAFLMGLFWGWKSP